MFSNDIGFWELYRRIGYCLQNRDNPDFAYGTYREDLKDDFLSALEKAYEVFTDNPEISNQLPDDRCDPIIGLTKIQTLCHQSLRTSRETERKGTQDSGTKAGATQRGDDLTGEALALAMLVEHSDWTDTKIAKAVGVNRTTLYDWPNFKKAKEALKQGKKKFPRGSKNGETGDMEAWDTDT